MSNIYKWDDVEFHKSFQPQDSYIAKIMEAAGDGYSGTKEEISSLTGIPTGRTSGKVVPHIRYAKYMGFIDYVRKDGVYSLSLTELGNAVMNEDKYLFENVTKLLAHYFMTDPAEGAPVWSFLYRYLPYHPDESISGKLISGRFSEIFRHDAKDNLNVVKNSYTEGFWHSLKLMSWDDDLCINSQVFMREYKFVYAYTLLKDWEKYKPDERELTTEQLSDELFWSRRFGFDSTEAMNVLDEIAAEGYIVLNKQLHPCTVVRAGHSEDIIGRLYELLN